MNLGSFLIVLFYFFASYFSFGERECITIPVERFQKIVALAVPGVTTKTEKERDGRASRGQGLIVFVVTEEEVR